MSVVTAECFSKFASEPALYDVVKITTCQLSIVKGSKLLILHKDPLTIVHTGLNSVIGNPQEIKKLMESGMEIENPEVEIPGVKASQVSKVV